MKIALIYNRNQRVAIGERCQRVLEKYKNLEISQFDLGEIQKVSSGFDLYFRVDDGDYTVIPKNLRPSAWWVSDTHLKNLIKKLKNRLGIMTIFFVVKKKGV